MNLQELPESIFDNEFIEELYFNNNRVTSISSKISKLKNLKIIKGKTNSIVDLPPEFYNLKNLVECDLSFNALRELSSDITRLQNLKKLNVSNNELDLLPCELCSLDIEELKYDGNYITYVPPNLVHKIINKDPVQQHFSHIPSEKMKKSLFNLLNDKQKNINFQDDNINHKISEIYEDVLKRLNENSRNKLSTFRSKHIHKELYVSFDDVLIIVWNRIKNNENSSRILEKLNILLRLNLCNCITCKINNIMSVLNIYYDDVDVIVTSTGKILNDF